MPLDMLFIFLYSEMYMKKIFNLRSFIINLSVCAFFASLLIVVSGVSAQGNYQAITPAAGDLQVKAGDGGLGFEIPTLGDLLTFAIRAFFAIAGLAALFYMLLGAFSWVTSGGDSDAVSAAQGKIQAAVVGVLIIVAVLAIVWTLEQVVFGGKICFGISCPVTLPSLL